MVFDSGGWLTLPPRGNFRMSLQKDIEREACLLKQNCEFRLGDGLIVRFWEDVWCGRAPLCKTFPRLHIIANSKRSMVVENWVTQEGVGGWNLRFVRHLRDWELDISPQFFNLISHYVLTPHVQISCFGWETALGVKSYFKLLERGHSMPVLTSML